MAALLRVPQGAARRPGIGVPRQRDNRDPPPDKAKGRLSTPGAAAPTPSSEKRGK